MSLKVILFDLDETLYPRESGLLREVGRRIRVWLCDNLGLTWEEAGKVQRDYFSRYGTTLNGLIAEQKIDPHDYLTFVHDIPIETYLQPNPGLVAMLAALPLRCAVYTNATTEYSWRVLRMLGVSEFFERVISIEDVGLRNKVYRDAYERVLGLLGAQGTECIMVEDTARNLWEAKAVGMTTVLVGADGATEATELTGEDHASVDFVVRDVLDVGRVVQRLVAA